MATIMASVLPQVTRTSVSGSMSMPMKCVCFFARASLKLGAPHVTAYWCGPSRATSARRSVSSFGGSKSGNPWDRLIAPHSLEMRVMRLITESVNPAVLSERPRMGSPAAVRADVRGCDVFELVAGHRPDIPDPVITVGHGWSL